MFKRQSPTTFDAASADEACKWLEAQGFAVTAVLGNEHARYAKRYGAGYADVIVLHNGRMLLNGSYGTLSAQLARLPDGGGRVFAGKLEMMI